MSVAGSMSEVEDGRLRVIDDDDGAIDEATLEAAMARMVMTTFSTPIPTWASWP